MSELVKFDEQSQQLVTTQEILLELQALNNVKKELEEKEKMFKEQLKQAMEQHGVKSIKNDVFSATYIEESTRTIFDSKKAKEFLSMMGQNIADFEKESNVKSSVRMSYK